MEFISISILIVLAVFFSWEIFERLQSAIAVIMNPPDSLPGTQLPGYLAGSVITIVLISLGVVGIAQRDIWLFVVASISYILGGLGESMAHSMRIKLEVGGIVAKEAAAPEESKIRASRFFLRLTHRYILPTILGYTWFAILQ